MNRVKTFKQYLTSTFISFSLVILLNSMLEILKIFNVSTSVNSEEVLNIFIICIFVNLLIYITDQISIKSQFIRIVIGIFDVIFVVFLMNIFVLGNYKFTWQSFIITIIFLTIVFLCVYGIGCIQNGADAKKINEVIKKRRNI